MGMTFNLANTKGTATMRLKAWNIYNVVFKGIEYVEGVNKDGKVWKAFKTKFSNEEGIFEPLTFCPGEKGDERLTGESGGKPWELPSAMESLMLTVAHLGEHLAPERFEKMRKVAFNIPEDFKKLVDTLSKVLEPAVNKSTQIKLVGNKKGYATIPNFISISKEGEVYTSDNWLGDNLAFTDYQVKQMQKQKDAKPTDMPTDNVDDVSAGSNNDLDFEI